MRASGLSLGRAGLFGVVAGLALAGSVVAASQELGRWRAASKTATAITGDVELGRAKLTINFASFPIAQIRELKPAEVTAAFNAEADANASGSLYRLSVPGAKKFLNKNTLCGGDETKWMVTYPAGKSLQLAFFSGAAMPVLTPEVMANTTDLCGTYSYVR